MTHRTDVKEWAECYCKDSHYHGDGIHINEWPTGCEIIGLARPGESASVRTTKDAKALMLSLAKMIKEFEK